MGKCITAIVTDFCLAVLLQWHMLHHAGESAYIMGLQIKKAGPLLNHSILGFENHRLIRVRIEEDSSGVLSKHRRSGQRHQNLGRKAYFSTLRCNYHQLV